MFREGVHPQVKYEPVTKGRLGREPAEVAIYDSAIRLVMGRKATDKDKGEKPFFLFVPYTQTYMPMEPESAWKSKTGNGRWADVLAQTDHYVGQLLDTVDELGIKDNTIFMPSE